MKYSLYYRVLVGTKYCNLPLRKKEYFRATQVPGLIN